VAWVLRVEGVGPKGVACLPVRTGYGKQDAWPALALASRKAIWQLAPMGDGADVVFFEDLARDCGSHFEGVAVFV
jgi:hypothetical protein